MKIITFLLFLLPLCSLHAQDYELGEVTVAELQQARHPADSSAAAAILFSKGASFMTYNENTGFVLVTNVEVKIKIYTKDGYGWGTKEVAYYGTDTDRETVEFNKAVTYNLVNGQIVKSKLKSDGEFTEQLTKNWKQKKIVLPEVKPGSIVEYKYTITSPYTQVLPDWKFQEEIPVNHSEYKTRIPEFYVFNQNFRGFFTPKVTRTSGTKSIIFTSKYRSSGMVTQTTFTNEKVDYMETATLYELDKLPAMKDEAYVNNIDNYRASIEHEISSVKFPDSPSHNYATSWEDVATSIYKFDDFGGELKKTGYFETELTAVLAGKKTQAEKMAAVFAFVKGRMSWNKHNSYSCENGVKKAYKDHVGNTGDINLMLTAMLRYAGLEANPVLVSTRSNKIALFPNRTAFNYVVCCAEADGKVLLLDATSKSALPNVLPVRALNWMGRLIKQDGISQSLDLVPQSVSKQIVTLTATVDATGRVWGKLRETYFDQNACLFRDGAAGISNESALEKLEKQYKGLEASNYKVTNGDALDKPVMEEYDYVHNGVSDVIADKIYLSPMLFLNQKENPFKQEKREYPIDFVFPHEVKYMINIMIPEGYVAESLPPSVNLGMVDNLGSFKYVLQPAGKQIQVGVQFTINAASVAPDYYKTLQDFFKAVIEKQNEKIVLKKA